MRNLMFSGLLVLASFIYSTPAHAQYWGQCWQAYCGGNNECAAYEVSTPEYPITMEECQMYGGYGDEESALRACASKTSCNYPTIQITCYTGVCRQESKYGCGVYEERMRVERGQGCPSTLTVTDAIEGREPIARQAFSNRKQAVDFFCKDEEGNTKDPNICTPATGFTNCWYNLQVGPRWVTKSGPAQVPYGTTTCPEHGLTRWDGEQDLYQTKEAAEANRPENPGGGGGSGTTEKCYFARCSQNRDTINDPELNGCEGRAAPNVNQDEDGNCPAEYTVSGATYTLFKTKEEAVAACAPTEQCLPSTMRGQFYSPTKMGDNCRAQQQSITYQRVDGAPTTIMHPRFGELPLYPYTDEGKASAVQYCVDNPDTFNVTGGGGRGNGGGSENSCFYAKCSYNRDIINNPEMNGCEGRAAPGISQDADGNCPEEYTAGGASFPLFKTKEEAIAACAPTEQCLPETMRGQFYVPTKMGDSCRAQPQSISYARADGAPTTFNHPRFGEVPLYPNTDEGSASAIQYCTDNPEKFSTGGGGRSNGGGSANSCFYAKCSYNRDIINNPEMNGCEGRAAPGISQDADGNCPATYENAGGSFPLFTTKDAAVAACAPTEQCLPETMRGQFYAPNKIGDGCRAQPQSISYARADGAPTTFNHPRFGEVPLYPNTDAGKASAIQYCTDHPDQFSTGGSNGGNSGGSTAERCWVMECLRQGIAVRSVGKSQLGGECTGNGVFSEEATANSAKSEILNCNNSSPVYYQNYTAGGNCVPETCNSGDGAAGIVKAPASRAARQPSARATSNAPAVDDLSGDNTTTNNRVIDRAPDMMDKGSRKSGVAPRLRDQQGGQNEPVDQPNIRHRGLAQ